MELLLCAGNCAKYFIRIMSFDLCNGSMMKNNAPSLEDVHILTSSECGNLYGKGLCRCGQIKNNNKTNNRT